MPTWGRAREGGEVGSWAGVVVEDVAFCAISSEGGGRMGLPLYSAVVVRACGFFGDIIVVLEEGAV